jgi:hypothetical protein
MEPQPDRLKKWWKCGAIGDRYELRSRPAVEQRAPRRFSENLPDAILRIKLPQGPDGEVWIAEPFWKESTGDCYYEAEPFEGEPDITWQPPETMPREASRFPDNNYRTTTAVQRDDGWWFKTIIQFQGD